MVCCLGWWHSDCRKDRKYLSLEAKKERQVFLSEKVCHTRVVSSSSWGKRFTVRQLNWCLSFTQVDSVDLIRISLYLISPNNSKVWVELCLLEQIVFSRGRKVRERFWIVCLAWMGLEVSLLVVLVNGIRVCIILNRHTDNTPSFLTSWCQNDRQTNFVRRAGGFTVESTINREEDAGKPWKVLNCWLLLCLCLLVGCWWL